MPFPAPEETVRLIFEARRAGDLRRVASLMHPDVEMATAVAGTVRGLDAVRGYFDEEREGRRTEVMAHRLEADGEDVIAHGRIRIVEGGALADSPARWRFTVRDGVVVKIALERT